MKLSSADVAVRLGAYNITEENETGAVQRNVSNIYVNPDWKPYGDKYDADLAILVLSENVTFSLFIQPICVPANDVVIDGAVIDLRGTVIGWGLGESKTHEEIPKEIVARALTNSLCYRTDPGIIQSLSHRSFCPQGEDGSPNKGDSGGGFFVLSKSTWVQYGIVSALRTNSTGHGVLSIYTNVKSFKRWILEIVTESGGEVGESTMKVTLTCMYSFTDRGYTCQINNLEVRYEHNEIDSIEGTHTSDNRNENVESIDFNDGFMFTLPDGLGKYFKNV